MLRPKPESQSSSVISVPSGREPGDVGQPVAAAAYRAAVEEPAAAEDRVLAAQLATLAG